jgi:AraC family transcriptional regulator
MRSSLPIQPRLFLEQLIDLLCLQLLRAHSALGAPPPPLVQRGLAKWQVKRVTSYVLDHLGDDITLQELADEVKLSRFRFCTAFRMATGCTPYARLTALRIYRARVLVADPSLGVIDIALCLGYATFDKYKQDLGW